MHKITLLILGAVFAVALAEGQYYVPRAYYTIDAEGHESARVPLRRLRRSLNPYPYAAHANANANANANAYGDNAEANAIANANANANAHARDWSHPSGGYGASNPNNLSSGMTRRTAGQLKGRSLSASSSVSVDSSGHGYYEQSTSVS